MRIKEILQQKGLTQKELAETLGMTPTGLSLAISEDGNPPLKRLRQIAEALNVSLSELFSDASNHKDLVAFFHIKGKSHTPTSIDEIMSVLKDWNEYEFHKVCHNITFNHIRNTNEGNIAIQELVTSLCALLRENGYPYEICDQHDNS